MKWKDFAKFMAGIYNTMSYIDDPNEDADDNVVYCPECGEPIYEEDYPEINYIDGCYVCPICESEFETDENDKENC
jgi:hypothetical protein